MPQPPGSGRVLIIVQNLPVPLDRRVWLECRALRAAGYHVSVICPKGPGDPAYAEVDGIHLYKYRPAGATRGLLSYLWEFAYSWLRTWRLAKRVRKQQGFDVIQACNPPDTYWALARRYRRRGVRFVYDQHDLNPEVFRSRFGEPKGLARRMQYRGLLWLERRTYQTATEVISTNESYRRTAISRGRRDPEHVTVVRSGPDTDRMRPIDPDPALRKGRRHLAVYLGIMGPQDGVDLVLRGLRHYVRELGRDDLHVALLGFGDCLDELREQAAELGLDDRVTFTGRADADTIGAYLSTAALGIQPDPLNPLNDVSTMNKTMEYMSYGVPVVAYDLMETRVSAGSTARYVAPYPDEHGGGTEPEGRRRDGGTEPEGRQGADGDAAAFAGAMADLLDRPDVRAEMAEAGRERAVRVLDWRRQVPAYVGVFDRLFGVDSAVRPADPAPPAGEPVLQDGLGRKYVDLDTPGALAESVIRRSGTD